MINIEIGLKWQITRKIESMPWMIYIITYEVVGKYLAAVNDGDAVSLENLKKRGNKIQIYQNCPHYFTSRLYTENEDYLLKMFEEDSKLKLKFQQYKFI